MITILLGFLVVLVMLASLAYGLFQIFFVEFPYFTATLIPNWFGGVRVVGPGTRPVFRPFESVGETASLKEKNIDDKMDAETSGEKVVTLDYSIEYWVVLHQAATFLRFTKEHIENAIKQRIKSLLSVEVRKLETRDEVLDQLPMIAGNVERQFNALFATQYGVGLRFVIDDPELPAKLAAEAEAIEAMEKTTERLALEMKATNERRGKEMVKLKSMAAAMVKTAAKQDPPQIMDLQTAMKIIQTQLGIIKESNSTNGLNRDTLSTLEKVLPSLIDKVFGKGKADVDVLEKLLGKLLKEALDGRK